MGEAEGVKHTVTEEDYVWAAEHARRHADDVLRNCTLGVYIILLTNITPVTLIQKKKESEDLMLKVPFSLQVHLQGRDGPYVAELSFRVPRCHLTVREEGRVGRGPGTSKSKPLF